MSNPYQTTLDCRLWKCCICHFHLQARNNRKNLLQHDEVQAFINCKWADYGVFVHILNVIFFIIFLTFLTAFALTSINPKEDTCRLSFLLNYEVISFIEVSSFPPNDTIWCHHGRALSISLWELSYMGDLILGDIL